MNKSRQEISDFHKKIKPILARVLGQTDANKTHKMYEAIVRPCRRLIQKCSCKSYGDMSLLCELAYWLYIYDYRELALEICESMHGLDFSGIVGCELGGVTDIFGLEIRIARELKGENRRFDFPEGLADLYFSKRLKRRLRYPRILREDELDVSRFGAFDVTVLHALFDMIGKGETGLYNDLNENQSKIEEAVSEYIRYQKEE